MSNPVNTNFFYNNEEIKAYQDQLAQSLHKRR